MDLLGHGSDRYDKNLFTEKVMMNNKETSLIKNVTW